MLLLLLRILKFLNGRNYLLLLTVLLLFSGYSDVQDLVFSFRVLILLVVNLGVGFLLSVF